MSSKPAVIVVVANGEVTATGTDGVEVVLVDFDSMRDYDSLEGTVDSLTDRLRALPISNDVFERARQDAIFGLLNSEVYTSHD